MGAGGGGRREREREGREKQLTFYARVRSRVEWRLAWPGSRRGRVHEEGVLRVVVVAMAKGAGPRGG